MLDNVREYYGKTLASSSDLQTNACCDQLPPDWLRPLLASLHDEVTSRYYGCGLVAPAQLDGARVLDLGCGSGRDVYVLSALVGERGTVVGVDMTPEQLAVARRHQDWHRDKFGHAQSNVSFVDGEIEKLDQLGLDDNSFDVVVSNCVVNLSNDKARVLRQVWRVLRQGGELYFSDVYADRRLDPALAQDPVLHGECLAGALYWHDFLDLAKACGFADPRLVESRPITVNNAEIQARLGAARFYSATYRLFKLDGLETACEDYGQAVIYRGTIERHPHAFLLDGHHLFETGKVAAVCGNTWRMLADTRFAAHFDFIGDFSRHFGIFPDCGTAMPFDQGDAATGGGACC